jgi:hypothetical protein
MCCVRVRLDRRHVSFLRFLLEGYDGLATISTVDRWASIVDLHVPEEQLGELRSLLDAVEGQLGISRVEEVAS